MRLSLMMRKGPMAGKRRDLDTAATTSGKIALGREPGFDGLILDGDVTVSRRHGELLQDHGQLVFANLSANGTDVDGKLVMGRQALRPGAILKLGGHEIEVQYQPQTSQPPPSDATEGSVWSSGPLARPAVRVLLAVYLLAMLLFAVFLASRGDDSAVRAYRQAREVYTEEYLSAADLPKTVREARLAKADRLAQELEAHVRGERWNLAEATCRELMTVDHDTDSPIYRFAARRLGEVADRKR